LACGFSFTTANEYGFLGHSALTLIDAALPCGEILARNEGFDRAEAKNLACYDGLMSFPASRSSLKLTGGTDLSFVTVGDKRQPAVLLIHGQPSSANSFRDIWSSLAEVAYVVAPDLPGFGRSDVLETTTFDNFAIAVTELLDRLEIRERFIYLHDFGAPVGFRIAMDHPEFVRGLIVQSANAHQTGLGPQWKATMEFWSHPNAENEAAATAHLTLEGIRSTYIRGLPDDVARRISPSVWEEDWRVMSQPGRIAAQRALLVDYGRYVARFAEISKYLRSYQPPALMVRGRHDPFFELAEILSWMEDLPRMEAHILDGAHFLLETHAVPAAKLIREFVERVNKVTGSGTIPLEPSPDRAFGASRA
jgi:pimeloyl-ACP methyl ester carboxylesterase